MISPAAAGSISNLDAVVLSVLGGTQPDPISHYLTRVRCGGRADDGLIQRFALLTWPDPPAGWTGVDRKPNSHARKSALETFQKLDAIEWRALGAKRDRGHGGDEVGQPYLRLTPDAYEKFLEWRTELEQNVRSGVMDPALESHLAKYRKLVPAVALISHLADNRTGDVDLDAVERALKWARYCESHAGRLYGSTVILGAGAARAIIGRIKGGHLLPPFSARDVERPHWARLTDRDTIDEALAMRVERHWLDVDTIDTRGRPAILYSLNAKAAKALGRGDESDKR